MTIDVKRWTMVLSAATMLTAFSGVPSVVGATRANFAQDQSVQGGPDERRLPLFGKITALRDKQAELQKKKVTLDGELNKLIEGLSF